MSHLPSGQIKKREDFLKARNGARSHGRAFVLQAIDRGTDDPQLRFGYTVTRKVGNSVERNRIKRRFRAAVAHLGGEIPAHLAGYDAVIIARRAALTQPFTQLTASLAKALKQVVANGPAKGQKRGQKQQDSNPSGG